MAVLFFSFTGWGQAQDYVFATNVEQEPKVVIDWKRKYDHEGITEICRKLAKTYPGYIRLESMGESFEGKRLWALTVSDFTSGDPDVKPALFLDGNITGNPFQGVEYALYTAWYLAENTASNPAIATLLKEKTLYIVPVVYPDTRDRLLQANLTRSFQSGANPIDDDGDGQIDEDKPNDLNGDGFITFMRRKSPTGRYLPDPANSLNLILAEPGQIGQYELLGYEGYDNDGDGSINEDPAGYNDPAVDWGWAWQPDYTQPGAYLYPFSLPENKAVKEFVLRHPNIAAVQTYRSFGGMSFPVRGEATFNFYSADQQVYELLSQYAENVVPELLYHQSNQIAAPVFGGELDWFRSARGIFTFSNELRPYPLQNQLPPQEETTKPRKRKRDKGDVVSFNAAAYVTWTPYEHPTYGSIEIGGFKKDFYQVQPNLDFEEDAYRNILFTFYQAYQTPRLIIQEVATKKLPTGMTEVTAVIANTRLLPTHSEHDLQNRIERPDYITLRDSTVVSGMIINSEDKPINSKDLKQNPARIEIANISGMGAVKVRWIVKTATPTLQIEVDSRKGGVVTRRF